MQDWTEFFRQFPPTKWVVIIGFAMLGAIMQRDMTITSRVIVFFGSIIVAAFLAEPIRYGLNLDPNWSDAVSACLALTGHNLASYALKASKDPVTTLRDILDVWRGKK
ncbi:hypothetical protein OIV19_21515 [Brucella sp. HL-2]|nr:hypothetical protein [Brucella sp. HL-2]MCV9910177.1 hypothetical protein [Brucella sp. HL-2]